MDIATIDLNDFCSISDNYSYMYKVLPLFMKQPGCEYSYSLLSYIASYIYTAM